MMMSWGVALALCDNDIHQARITELSFVVMNDDNRSCLSPGILITRCYR